MKKIITLALVVGCAVLVFPSAANAGGDKWVFENETGETAYDLHIDFKNGCTYDAANSSPFPYDDGTPGTSGNHHLAGATVADGNTATVRFTTTGTPPRIKEWYWTKADESRLGDIHTKPPEATVSVTATYFGHEVTLSYESDSSRPRAFALDITADSGATIDSLVEGSYKIGESNSVGKGYGIFMGSIYIDGVDGSPTYGEVLSYGDPVAPIDDPCAAGEFGDPSITMEMGSLYEDGNEPDCNGVLLKFNVSADCNVTIAQEAARGGVVMEDPNQPVNFVPTGCEVLHYPASWDYSAQCYGDTDGGGIVNLDDVWVLVDSFMQAYPGALYDSSADFDRNGTVNLDDVWVLVDYFMTEPVPVHGECEKGGIWLPE